MKFQNVASFEKHLAASLSAQLSASYMVVCASQDERKKLISRVVKCVQKKHPSCDVLFYAVDKGVFKEVMEKLGTRPFFSEHIAVILDGCQDLVKKEREILEGYLIRPSPFATFILGASSFKDFSSVYTKAKKELVVLDLSEEKPWDKQKRLSDWALQFIRREKKSIAPEALAFLFEMCGPDVLLLEQELNKVISYIGEKVEISLADLEKIGSCYVLPGGWQMAEKLVWEGHAGTGVAGDLASFLPLIGQVRYHLQIGRQLAFHREHRRSREEMGELMPQVRPGQLTKYLGMLGDKGSAFFDEALSILFRVELLSKNSSFSPDLLWEMLVAKILYAKQSYAR